jgi:hypothetical protein
MMGSVATLRIEKGWLHNSARKVSGVGGYCEWPGPTELYMSAEGRQARVWEWSAGIRVVSGATGVEDVIIVRFLVLIF